MRDNFRYKFVFLIFTLLFLVPSVSADDELTYKWFNYVNDVFQIKGEKKVWNHLSDKEYGFTCFNIQNDHGNTQFECARILPDNKESFLFSIFFDKSGKLNKLSSTCFYIEETPEDNIMKLKDSFEKYMESNNKLTVHEDTDDISSYTLGEPVYNAYDYGDYIIILSAVTDNTDEYQRVTFTAVEK